MGPSTCVPTAEGSNLLQWRAVLQIAERSMGNAHHHAFDATKYMLLIESEMANECRLRQPLRLYQEYSRREVMQLLVRCDVHPVGHRLAVYLALRTLSEGEDTGTTLEPCNHMDVPQCGDCDPEQQEVHKAPSSSGTSSGTSYSCPSEEGAFRSWTRTQSKAMLLSALDDAHVQLLRPGSIGKRVRVGCPTVKAQSTAAPFSGVFELDSPMEPPPQEETDCQRFVWVDIVGSWASSRTVQSVPPEATQAFETKMQRIREQYASPPGAMEDERLQRVLSTASKKPRSVLSNSQQRFASVQQDTLASVIRSVEMEYGIQLPLNVVARRAQDPEYVLVRDRRTTTSSSSLHSDSASMAKTSERIRHRIEESITMSYCNASMFAEDELRELREHAKAQQRHSPGRSKEKLLSTFECDRLEEEKRLLEELSHQHVLVLHTASSPLSARTQSGLLPPTGSEQRSDLLKTHHNQIGLILSTFVEQSMMSGAGSGGRVFSEPWILYIDTHQRVAVTIRPEDTVVVGRMHHHFDVSFRHLWFSEFVGLLIEASVVQFRQHVDAMYATLDEVQRFLAPSTVQSLVFGGSGASRGSALGQEEERRRKRHYNVRAYDPEASLLVNYWHGLRVLLLRVGRSAWRKIKRRRTRPRDITIAALRLLNLVNRQAAVFNRVLSESRRMTDLTRAALHALSSLADDKHARITLVPRHAQVPVPQTPHLHRTPLASFAPKGQPRPHDHSHLSVAPLWSASHERVHQLDATSEEALQDTERLAEEMIERCRQLRHSSSELMSLAMALDAETYDENLAIIGGVTALFSPMSWWATNMGMNFRCPLFEDKQGYYVTLVCYGIFVWLLLWWFYQRYHNVDLVETLASAATRVAMCCRRRKV